MKILAYSEIYDKYCTVIPKQMRDLFDIDEDTVIEWGVDENDNPQINFRKRVTVNDILGMIDEDSKESSVELKKSLYK